nr:hypothetical protein [uncultured Oribacterium sp.]
MEIGKKEKLFYRRVDKNRGNGIKPMFSKKNWIKRTEKSREFTGERVGTNLAFL